jgi:hypothetical protein
MKIKTVVKYGVEKQKELVGVVIDEFWRVTLELYRLLGNPKAERCSITVQLDQDTRVPISQLTSVETRPKVLDDEYDPATWKRCREDINFYLGSKEGRRLVIEAYESGASSITLHLHKVPTVPDETRWSPEIQWRDINSRKKHGGLM